MRDDLGDGFAAGSDQTTYNNYVGPRIGNMPDLESLLQSMGVTADSGLGHWMVERGVALADEETMSQAIHDVYCGIAADHPVPNAKDHAQALALIASLRKQMETLPPA